MEYLSTTYGLVTDNDPTTENGQLFLQQLMLLDPYNQELIDTMNTQLLYSKVDVGLYHRNPQLTNKILSNDNLSGIFSYSVTNNTQERFEIWNHLLKHLGTYDNTQGKSKQLSRFLPYNPSNFFIWGLSAESNIYLAFLPFYIINLVLACNKPIEDTSGKILYWVEMSPHKDHWLVKRFWRYYERKMIAQYGVGYIKQLMKRYHGGNSPEFPINKILGV